MQFAMTNRPTAILLALAVALTTLVWMPAPALAATSPCNESSSAPTTNGTTAYGNGTMNCSGTGRTVASVTVEIHIQRYGLWGYLSPSRKSCAGGGTSKTCYTSASCNGLGTNNYKVWSQGTDNIGDTKAAYGIVDDLTC